MLISILSFKSVSQSDPKHTNYDFRKIVNFEEVSKSSAVITNCQAFLPKVKIWQRRLTILLDLENWSQLFCKRLLVKINFTSTLGGDCMHFLVSLKSVSLFNLIFRVKEVWQIATFDIFLRIPVDESW